MIHVKYYDVAFLCAFGDIFSHNFILAENDNVLILTVVTSLIHQVLNILKV